MPSTINLSKINETLFIKTTNEEVYWTPLEFLDIDKKIALKEKTLVSLVDKHTHLNKNILDRAKFLALKGKAEEEVRDFVLKEKDKLKSLMRRISDINFLIRYMKNEKHSLIQDNKFIKNSKGFYCLFRTSHSAGFLYAAHLRKIETSDEYDFLKTSNKNFEANLVDSEILYILSFYEFQRPDKLFLKATITSFDFGNIFTMGMLLYNGKKVSSTESIYMLY